MKPAQTLFSGRAVFGLAVAGAALLSMPAAFAQTPQSSFYSFQVTNNTYSAGDPTYSITDDLTFTNLQISEVFADNFTQIIPLSSLDTGIAAEQTSAFFFDTSTPGSLIDPIHGALTSAVLTGTLDNGLNPGPTQTVNVATSFGGTTTPEIIYSTFSADLLGPSSTALGLGDFSLVDSNNDTPFKVVIGAAPVPEASTVVSLGLMLTLGLGALVATRRRRTATAAN